MYPDSPDDPRPRWIARAVDSTGRIVRQTNGSFDRDYVVKDAQERWPGRDVHMISDVSVDTRVTASAEQGTLTNASLSYVSKKGNRVPVEGTLDAPVGRELSLTFKGGSNKVVVPPGTPVVTFAPGSRDDLKVGMRMFAAATPNAEGKLAISRVTVEKDGVAPPM